MNTMDVYRTANYSDPAVIVRSKAELRYLQSILAEDSGMALPSGLRIAEIATFLESVLQA